jgi:hypothetical protein
MGRPDSERLVGVSGHQAFDARTTELVREAFRELLAGGPVAGITCLAAGADQIFAETVLELGGRILVICPCGRYEEAFTDDAGRAGYRSLLAAASDLVTLPFDEPSDDAFESAGCELVDRCDHLIAVWDGLPAAGRGGTAGVVRYARSQGKRVSIVWPDGARRA